MHVSNEVVFHLTEKIPLITLNIDGILSKRTLCTCIHFSWKDKVLCLTTTDMQNQVMTWARYDKDPKVSRLENCLFFLIWPHVDTHWIFNRRIRWLAGAEYHKTWFVWAQVKDPTNTTVKQARFPVNNKISGLLLPATVFSFFLSSEYSGCLPVISYSKKPIPIWYDNFVRNKKVSIKLPMGLMYHLLGFLENGK